MMEDDYEVVERVRRVRHLTMKDFYVFTMAQAQLRQNTRPGKGAPKRMIAAARRIDEILRKEYGSE